MFLRVECSAPYDVVQEELEQCRNAPPIVLEGTKVSDDFSIYIWNNCSPPSPSTTIGLWMSSLLIDFMMGLIASSCHFCGAGLLSIGSPSFSSWVHCEPALLFVREPYWFYWWTTVQFRYYKCARYAECLFDWSSFASLLCIKNVYELVHLPSLEYNIRFLVILWYIFYQVDKISLTLVI